MGFARPRRIAITPAIVVVLTAPIPTSRTPSFPLAGAIFSGLFTGCDYIIEPDGLVQELPSRRSTCGDHGRRENG